MQSLAANFGRFPTKSICYEKGTTNLHAEWLCPLSENLVPVLPEMTETEEPTSTEETGEESYLPSFSELGVEGTNPENVV